MMLRAMRALDTLICFAEEVATRCELLDGAIQDFNSMLDRRSRGRPDGRRDRPALGAALGCAILLHAVTRAWRSRLPGAAPVTLVPTDTAVIRLAESRVDLEAGATAILACIGQPLA